MKRSHFLRNAVLGGAVTLAAPLATAARTTPTENDAAPESPGTPAAAASFQLNYAFHEGMFAASAGKSFLDQIRFGHEQGFRAIEDNGYMDRPVAEQEKIGSLLAKLGMTMGVFVVNFDHWPLSTSLTSGDAVWRKKFLDACKAAIDSAKRCNARWATVVPGNYDRKLPLQYQTANVIDSLRQAAAILEPHGLIMVLEALSDTPDLFLRNSDQTFAICKAVDSPSCKYLYDIYHMQRNEGNIIRNMDAAWEQIAYLQIGDNPGRNEPGTGELNYRNIFSFIQSKGYQGVLGMEHGNQYPGKDGEQKLIAAYREADAFTPTHFNKAK